ncbi:MAG: hypothetical protein QOF57_1804, partial [Frankiaceae bacterium]|nr:hypothetical protein [Frankiaceae bacterium]
GVGTDLSVMPGYALTGILPPAYTRAKTGPGDASGAADGEGT